MHILVTGGAGFIGSHLVDRLVRDQTGTVTVLDNLRRGSLENLAELRNRIKFVQGDVRDPRLLSEIMADAELVYHLAAQSNVIGAEEDPDYSFSTNVMGTFTLLRAAEAAGVRRAVFTSSREVYGDPESLPVPETAPLRPKNSYGASKAAAEMYCRLSTSKGFEVQVLRLANVYGPRDFGRVIPIFLESALMGEPLTVYGGGQVLDFIWIDTVVECLVQAGLGPLINDPTNVGSGAGITILELAKRILIETESSSLLNLISARPAEVRAFVADTRKMEKIFGLAPPADPLEHLRDLASQRRRPAQTAIGRSPQRH